MSRWIKRLARWVLYGWGFYGLWLFLAASWREFQDPSPTEDWSWEPGWEHRLFVMLAVAGALWLAARAWDLRSPRASRPAARPGPLGREAVWRRSRGTCGEPSGYGRAHGADSLMLLLATISTIAVVLGLLDMPYSFYMLLRIVLCLAAVVGFAAARRRDDRPWTWAYAALAVLYNPVLPVHLGAKGLWIVVNAGTLIVLWVGAVRFRGVMSPPRS